MQSKKVKGFLDREPQTITDDRLRAVLKESPAVAQRATITRPGQVVPGSSIKVTSTYDARPINAQDFYKSGGELTISADEFTESAEFSFVVPDGYIAVIRNFSFEFDPIYNADTVSLARTSITVDSERLFFNDDILNLQISGLSGFIPTFFIAQAKQIVGIESTRISTITLTGRNIGLPITFTPTYTASFAGNLLQSRGLPKQFEIGGFS